MIQGIFYARFLPQEGTKIVAQSPPGCIVAAEYSPHLKPPLVDFDIVAEYIIPRKAFFNRFITTTTPDGKYSIFGFPVSIPHERYHRNEFIFNFGLVVESDVDQIPYERLVRRLALIFAEMERQGRYLSSEGWIDDGRRPIESVLEIVKEDLNNFGECMIPIGEANTINMKLFPYHAPPPPIHGWHVPVPKTKLLEIVHPTWDLTLQRVIPHVDGVNDVRRIAWLADVSLPLTICALQHLLYYDTILLLDMFFFGSCYAPRPGIHDFVANRGGMVDECAAYVCIETGARMGPPSKQGSGDSGKTIRGRPGDVESSMSMVSGTSSLTIPIPGGGGATPSISISSHSQQTPKAYQSSTPRPTSPTSPSPTPSLQPSANANPNPVSHYLLIKLLTTFCAGRSIMEWIRLHHQDSGFDVLRHIDVRRLVQFGVVKGLLYRVHKFPVSKAYIAALATGRRTGGGEQNGGGENGMRRRRSRRGKKNQEDEEGLHMKVRRRGNRNGNLESRDQDDNDEEDDDEEDAMVSSAWEDEILGSREDDEETIAYTALSAEEAEEARKRKLDLRKMLRYADGQHSFDQIITEQNLTDAEILSRLKSFRAGDVALLYR
ncbi:nitrogen permease regulator 2 [Xylariaceae sp. FL0255]|nr:nitrogen permease regulator 2 [Xylariaceae sp. FL0255]